MNSNVSLSSEFSYSRNIFHGKKKKKGTEIRKKPVNEVESSEDSDESDQEIMDKRL